MSPRAIAAHAALSLVLVAASAAAQQQTGAPAGIPVPPPSIPQPPATESVAPDTHSFRVLVVDGRNGLPAAGIHVTLWYDEVSGAGYTVVTDARGLALMPAPVGDPIRVMADPRGITDCRRPARYSPRPAYTLAAIASKGVAADNICGDLSPRPSPGELVLFVRPQRWYEKFNRNGDPNVP